MQFVTNCSLGSVFPKPIKAEVTVVDLKAKPFNSLRFEPIPIVIWEGNTSAIGRELANVGVQPQLATRQYEPAFGDVVVHIDERCNVMTQYRLLQL